MNSSARKPRGIDLFSRANAPLLDETGMARATVMDDAARACYPQLKARGGLVAKLLYGDPKGPDRGFSLAWLRVGPNYRLPRHSHSVDCLYYIVKGEAHLGKRVLREGDGFFVPATAPYAYTAGSEGIELLEFRAENSFDSEVHESTRGWADLLGAADVYADDWAAVTEQYT